MAWIESHTQTKRHRKNVAIARELRLKPVWMMGHLHSLWHAALEQQEDGDLSSWSDDMIASAADYVGDARKFVLLLRKHKLLDDAKTIHDWLDYAGLYLTRKYAGRYRDKLVLIWAKHGRIYGEVKKPPDIPNGSCNENQTTTKQKTNSPQDGWLVSSKDSSEMEGREFFNPGMHLAVNGQAVRLVALFLERVRTSHRSTTMPAVTALGQILLDCPNLEIAAIERGIEAYAAECDKAETPRDKRVSPLKFFQEKRWESYSAGPAIAEKSEADRARESDERLKKTLGVS